MDTGLSGIQVGVPRSVFLSSHIIRGRVLVVKYSKKVRLSSVKHLHCMYMSCNVSCPFKCLFPHSFLPLYHSVRAIGLPSFFVGNLPFMASPSDLIKYLAWFGPVTDFFDIPATEKHRGFGFVKFKNGFDSLCLLSTLHVYGGNHLIVKEVKTKTQVCE